MIEGLAKNNAQLKTVLENQTSRMREVENDVDYLYSDFEGLHNSHNEEKIKREILAQALLKNSIEINGIPILPDENGLEIVQKLFKLIDVNLQISDVSSCYRQGKNPREFSNGNTLHPGLVVDSVRECDEHTLMANIKTLGKSISSTDLGILNDPPSSVFVNEKLTPYFKRIFFLARREKAAGKIKYVWTRNGLILA
uniref:Uncharacterized protein n=1 Tax=Bracon brevicornis TaxID=1563983 RepID=A0A6V7KQN2_9HYME